MEQKALPDTQRWTWLKPATWRTMWRPSHVLILPERGMHHLQEAGGELAGAQALIPSTDMALLRWREWCVAHAGQRCKVALSCAWVMAGQVSDTQANDKTQAMAEMARQWDHYMNIGADQLQRDWLLRATRSPGGWLVCAIPRQLVTDVLAVAKTYRVDVVWLGAWWTMGLKQWLRFIKPSALAAGTSMRQLHIQEPGWCLHAQASTETQGVTLSRLWSEPVASDTSGVQQGASVALPRYGAAAASLVWDDAATQALVAGQSPAWAEAAQ